MSGYDRAFSVKLDLAEIPSNSSIARERQADTTNLGVFLNDVDRIPEIYLDSMRVNRSLLSQRGALGDAKQLAEKAEPGPAKEAAEALVEKLSLEKQALEAQVLEDCKKIWTRAFSPQEVFHFLAQIPEKTRNGIVEKIKKANPGQTIHIPDMGIIYALEQGIENAKDAQKERGVTPDTIQYLEGVIAAQKKRLEEEIERIQPEMEAIYRAYDQKVQQQFQAELVNLAMPQAFAVLPTAVFRDIFKPQTEGTHFAVSQNCSKTRYLFTSSEDSKAVDVKVHMEIYATEYMPMPADPFTEPSMSPAQEVKFLSGEKRAPTIGDCRLFQNGKEVWVNKKQFEAIKKRSFGGYDCMLTVETHHKAISLSYSTPESVTVIQHVDVPLDQRFLAEPAAVKIQETNIDDEVLSRSASSASLATTEDSGYPEWFRDDSDASLFSDPSSGPSRSVSPHSPAPVIHNKMLARPREVGPQDQKASANREDPQADKKFRPNTPL